MVVLPAASNPPIIVLPLCLYFFASELPILNCAHQVVKTCCFNCSMVDLVDPLQIDIGSTIKRRRNCVLITYETTPIPPFNLNDDKSINKISTSDLEKYKKKLKSLNKLSSPIQLFNDYDLLFQNYSKLKKEYCLKWEMQQLYKQTIRSFIKSKSLKNTDIYPLKKIESLISNLRNIQFSINELFKSFNLKTKSNKSKSKSKQTTNIKPSHAKKLSTSSSDIVLSAKKKKKKIKKQQHNIINNSVVLFNNSNTKMNRLHLTSASVSTAAITVSNRSMRRKSSARSFGELYSKQFKYNVTELYRKNMETDTNTSTCTGTSVGYVDNDDRALRIVSWLHDNYYGQGEVFTSPFGIRPVIYCDWTASGKALECVETYIVQEMLTLYANTHTTTSITGIQTSSFRSEARSIILQSLHGDINEDVVIFCGNGSTAAMYKLANVLMKNSHQSYKPSSTIVFISIYEHNSNIFIWKELGIKVIVINESINGGIDEKLLEKYLKFYTESHMKQKYTLLIGSFTAASNVSGITNNVNGITQLLHKYGALSFWDYATAGPYLDINMSGSNLDAVFLSPHKFLGGPGSPGVLCAKKKLFQNYVPVIPGGGTVFVAYGTGDGEWEYLDSDNNIEEREEGGTPNIIGSIRASFAFIIKDHLGTNFIKKREANYLKYFLEQTSSIANLLIMGNTLCNRLPVISFLISHTQHLHNHTSSFGCSGSKTITKYLHYNYISVLLNDLFGIQGRGGCACAGMYGVNVLNINNDDINYVIDQLRNKKNELSRPGYYRINLHYTLNKQELEYIINAIKYVCYNAWKFICLYDIDVKSGNFYHRKTSGSGSNLRSLLDVSFEYNNNNKYNMKYKKKHLKIKNKSLNKNNFNKFFKMADNILRNLNKLIPSSLDAFKNENKINDPNAWYWLPSELYNDVKNINII